MTPRCFAAWSKGRSDRALREQDERTALAFITAQFTRTEKRIRLQDYLVSGRRSRRQQTTEEMLDVFRQFQARGAGMNIRRIH